MCVNVLMVNNEFRGKKGEEGKEIRRGGAKVESLFHWTRMGGPHYEIGSKREREREINSKTSDNNGK